MGGRYPDVSEGVPGMACGCRCPNPACGQPLVAKVRQIKPNQYGKYKTKHLAHPGNHVCITAPETALHLLAKEIVEGERLLLLPEVIARYGTQARVLHKSQEVKFTAALQEATSLGNVIPDIFVSRGD